MTTLAPAGTDTGDGTPDTAAQVLTYNVHTNPKALQAGSGATIDVTVKNNTTKDVEASALTITIKIGSGPNDLTEDTSFTTRADWTLTRGKPGVFAFTPKGDDGTLVPGDQAQFTIEGFTVNKHAGAQTPLTITTTLDTPKGTDQYTKQLSKLHGGFDLYDFTPEHLVVSPGTPATVQWAIKQPGEAKLKIKHPAEQGDGSKETPVTGKQSYSTRSIWRTTPFRLTASLGDATYSLFTMVHVTEPNLIAGNLTVNGTTNIINSRDLENFDPLRPRLANQESLYTAPTDGILTAYLKTLGLAVKQAHLYLRVTDATQKLTAFDAKLTCKSDITSREAGERMEIPIEAGQKILVRTSHNLNPDKTYKQPSYYMAELTFHALGPVTLTHNKTTNNYIDGETIPIEA